MTKGTAMNCRSTLAASTALAALVVAAPASADLTATEAWGVMKNAWEDVGYTVTGDETTLGGRLSISNLVLSVPLDDTTDAAVAEATVSLRADAVLLEPLETGSVQVIFPAEMQLLMELETLEDGEILADATLNQSGFELQISGTPENATIDYSADMIMYTLDEVVIDDDQIDAQEISAAVSLNALAGQSRIEMDAEMRTTEQIAIGGVSISASFQSENSQDRVTFNGSISDLSLESDTTMPAGVNRSNLPDMIANGVNSTTSMRSGQGSFAFAANSNGSRMTVNATTQSALTVVGLEEGSVKMANGVNGFQMDAMAPVLPVPIAFEAETLTSSFSFPLAVSDAAQPFGFGLSLEGLSVSEMLWDMADPGRVLPRDPATVILQLSGMARILMDFGDKDAILAMQMGEILPAMPETLDLDTIRVSIGGAELQASGAFAFDGSDSLGMDGPRPSGTVNIQVDGAQALITNLIRMGILNEDTALGARMALSVFAVPGSGPDNLTSEIEVTEEGSILANGMRIR
jgi:hypothetical protein